jgi:hypothetical protein
LPRTWWRWSSSSVRAACQLPTPPARGAHHRAVYFPQIHRHLRGKAAASETSTVMAVSMIGRWRLTPGAKSYGLRYPWYRYYCSVLVPLSYW